MAEESETRPWDWKLNQDKQKADLGSLLAECQRQGSGEQGGVMASKSCIQRITHSYLSFMKTYNENLPTYTFKALGGEEEEEEEEEEEAAEDEAEGEAEGEAEEEAGDKEADE